MDHKLSNLRLMPFLGTVLVVLLVLAGASLYYAAQGRYAAAEIQREVATLADAAGRAPGAAFAAINGSDTAFSDLTALAGKARAAIRALPPTQRPAAAEAFAGAIETVTAARQDVLSAIGASGDVSGAESDMQAVLARLSDAIPARSRAAADDAAVLLARIALTARTLPRGVPDPVGMARFLGEDEMRLGQRVLGLLGKDDALGLLPIPAAGIEDELGLLEARYRSLSDATLAVIAAADGLEGAREAADAVAMTSADLQDQLPAVSAPEPVTLGPLSLTSPWFALWMVIGALIVGLIIAVHSFSGEDSRRIAEQQARQNERNQAAILRLLDELGSLADGDLTVRATVTEDITGAIADSINYAIEALRDLVATINETGIRINEAARQTQATAGHLAQASETQSKHVGDATESIARMAASIEAVSGDAERSADVARHSVDVAHKGGDAVRRTIEGMNTIRETIQDTSKRIKRLGESSQEIGNIVELINDIAEQTNILALNASIQASMAGEAGRGFAVVADEVQRLAERSANATKQIEVLVKTIQSDTNEAVVSMERSTTDVVGGALLAENAGAALDEIEDVSNQIANLVQNISGTAHEQALAAGDITRNMGVLREVSSQRAEATSATSESIGKLAELSAQLRNSVAGFRLPDTSESPGPEPEPPLLEEDEPRIQSAGA
jgi:twitching motility protein PilJ